MRSNPAFISPRRSRNPSSVRRSSRSNRRSICSNLRSSLELCLAVIVSMMMTERKTTSCASVALNRNLVRCLRQFFATASTVRSTTTWVIGRSISSRARSTTPCSSQRERSDCRRVEQVNWETPSRVDWVETLDRAIGAAVGDVVLAAHSLGCATVAHWAATVRLDASCGLTTGRPPDEPARLGARWERWRPDRWRLLVAYGEAPLPVALVRHGLTVAGRARPHA